MNTLQRIPLTPIGTMSGRSAGSSRAALAPPREPVLPSRGASRQLELPFLAQPSLPHHKLRTG
jgi:hypothetical protein